MRTRAVPLAVLFLISATSCGARKPTNLLAIGNSITVHAPYPAVGWYGDWGMAAPSRADDYSHLSAAAMNIPVTPMNLPVENDPDLSQIPPMANKVGPGTMVVLEFGDNVQSASLDAFGTAYRQLAATVSRGYSLACLSTWWTYANIDNVIKSACEQYGGHYIYIGDLRTDPTNTDLQTVQYSNWQVNDHPRQWGHAHIAARLISYLGSR